MERFSLQNLKHDDAFAALPFVAPDRSFGGGAGAGKAAGWNANPEDIC